MDLETYRTVLAWKLQRKLSTVKQWGFDEAELALRQDMAAMKVVWYNNFLKDWWCFMRNTHPVMATCLSHRLHMVSKRKRFFVYYMLIALHMTFSVLAAESQTCLNHFECDISGTNTRRWCCTVEFFGLLALYEKAGVWGLSAIFAVSTIVFGQLWFLLAACGCCQHKPPKQRHRWELCAIGSLIVFGLCAFVLLVYDCYYIAKFNLVAQTTLSFAIMKAISFCGAFLFQSAIFLHLWLKQTRSPEDFRDKFHLAHEDLLDMQFANSGLPRIRFRPANSVFFASDAELPGALGALARAWRRLMPGDGFGGKAGGELDGGGASFLAGGRRGWTGGVADGASLSGAHDEESAEWAGDEGDGSARGSASASSDGGGDGGAEAQRWDGRAGPRSPAEAEAGGAASEGGSWRARSRPLSPAEREREERRWEEQTAGRPIPVPLHSAEHSRGSRCSAAAPAADDGAAALSGPAGAGAGGGDARFGIGAVGSGSGTADDDGCQPPGGELGSQGGREAHRRPRRAEERRGRAIRAVAGRLGAGVDAPGKGSADGRCAASEAEQATEQGVHRAAASRRLPPLHAPTPLPAPAAPPALSTHPLQRAASASDGARHAAAGGLCGSPRAYSPHYGACELPSGLDDVRIEMGRAQPPPARQPSASHPTQRLASGQAVAQHAAGGARTPTAARPSLARSRSDSSGSHGHASASPEQKPHTPLLISHGADAAGARVKVRQYASHEYGEGGSC